MKLSSFRSRAALTIAALPLMLALTTTAATAQTFTTLYSFNGTDGEYPQAALVLGTDGNLYGTTEGGGPKAPYGTVFKITPSGTLTTLYDFCSQRKCTDGEYPYAGLIQGTDGNFYGTTFEGGATGVQCDGLACGTVFKITSEGTLTTLYSFCSQFNCPDGAQPQAGLVEGIDGNFYGTTSQLGANGGGTVFKITPGGTLTTIRNLDPPFGEGPMGALIQGSDGNFYGTAYNTGNPYKDGAGAVLKVTPDGALTTLYSFCSQSNCTDGEYPEAGLVQGIDGNFYGTTAVGGANDGSYPCNKAGCGTVFKITSSGTLTTLYSFCPDGCENGAFSEVPLVQGTDGSFYGITEEGGGVSSCWSDSLAGCGTIFKITPSGTLTRIYSFCSQGACTYANYPSADAGLIQSTDGNFYGTTRDGGAYNDGTVFRLSVGLGPFVETQTASGKVGAAIKILGTDLTGATSVTFNGIAATFTVRSGFLIIATVPDGANTGFVAVTTPNGTLTSNKEFQVRP
ncbi:MAG TPA: choice-of-anchor tandem repeat GloVer-containing protein [Candidatus Aquilonibacter sp.]|nr:choice-of-anchor tandem repeat GloVer-containing protein [Candidatus Aquilonibacter sp.]